LCTKHLFSRPPTFPARNRMVPNHPLYNAMMLDTVLGLDVRGDDARATPGAPRVGREGGGAWMEPAPEQREVGGGSWWCLLVRGAPLASYGLVAHFPSCSPVVVVVVVAHVFEQRLTRLAYVLVRVCLRVRCLSVWSLRGRAPVPCAKRWPPRSLPMRRASG
jgi:hypothetical protein